MEFKRRAYTSGNMKPRDSILIGDLIEVNEQVGIVYYLAILYTDYHCEPKFLILVETIALHRAYTSVVHVTAKGLHERARRL